MVTAAAASVGAFAIMAASAEPTGNTDKRKDQISSELGRGPKLLPR
jgi:hypothetical protein